MSCIEVDGKKYYEESYLKLASRNTERARAELQAQRQMFINACALVLDYPESAYLIGLPGEPNAIRNALGPLSDAVLQLQTLQRDLAAATLGMPLADPEQTGDWDDKDKLDWLISQVADALSERDRWKAVALNKAGDDLCHLPSDFDPALTPIPPQAEFLESCRRYHTQMAERNGELNGCRTIAQLEQRVAQLELQPAGAEGTVLGRMAAMAKFARERCGHNPLEARPYEVAICEHIDKLEAELASARAAQSGEPPVKER